MIVLRDIIKKYNNKIILNNINLSINKKEIIGLIGENGAGKTTLIKMISGLIKPNEGQLKRESKTTLSTLLDDGGLIPELTAYENIRLKAIRLKVNDNDIKYVMDLLGIAKYGSKKVKNFSLGMKRRTAIALCLLNKPDVLLLDEPINGLDPQGIKDIRNIIENLHKNSDISILVSSHYLDQLSKIATQYVFMSYGKIIENISKSDLENKLINKLIIKVPEHKIDKTKEVMDDYFPTSSSLIAEFDEGVAYSINKLLNNEVIITLIENNIPVTEIYNEETSLEEYFLELVKEGSYVSNNIIRNL